VKLVFCAQCYTLVELKSKYVAFCPCESAAGKYLNDNLTAVVTKDSIVVGIDNNTFRPAVERYLKYYPEGDEPQNKRIDFFFVGWIPTIPGEVIVVETAEEVEQFDSDYDAGNDGYSSPPVSQEVIRCNKQVCYCDNKGFCKHQKD
jgi:hypothetical protein